MMKNTVLDLSSYRTVTRFCICNYQEELCGIVDVPNPDKLSVSERRDLRIKAENKKFDEDHYV